MKIIFHGGAQTVTGSKHLIELDNGKRILLDCGMFQGHGEIDENWNRHFGFNPSSIDYLILSHAHIDHSGLIPLLVAEGFKGEIIATPATLDLCQILLEDSAKIQESEFRYNSRDREAENNEDPLYTIEDAKNAIKLFRELRYRIDEEICEGVVLNFADAGHIIGSAIVNLDITENGKTTKITFSGDVGRYKDLILNPPETFRQADYILLESTYGDSLHDDALPVNNRLLEIIKNTCVDKKGKVIIPAFSVGRTQEILYALNSLELDGTLPDVKYIVDSPLAEKATAVVKAHPWNFNKKVKEVLKVDYDPFDFKGLRYIEDADESKNLQDDPSPMVIIASSGMAEAGRVKHHIRNNIEDANSTILLVGYAEPSSLAGKLKNGVNPIYIFGQQYQVNAKIESLQSMSAHGDRDDLVSFLECQNPQEIKKIFLVHGETDVQHNFKNHLQDLGFKDIEIPHRHQSFELE